MCFICSSLTSLPFSLPLRVLPFACLSYLLCRAVLCRASGWGFKAQQVLGAVRGKDFRHEKTKKKRGSYKGGNIDPHATFSYKFESDDE